MDAEIGQDGAAGFTLIELMIVVMILSLLAVTASLGVNRPRSAETRDWARFKAVHDLLREQAVLGREVLGLALEPDGYQRMRRAGGGWEAVGERVDWRGAVQVQEPFDTARPVAFQPAGQSTPIRLRFDDGTRVVVCEGDGWNAVTCSS